MNPAPELYLDLLKRCLLRDITPESDFFDTYAPATLSSQGASGALQRVAGRILRSQGMQVLERSIPDFGPLPDDPPEPSPRELRLQGRILSRCADTLIGRARLDNLQECLTDVISSKVPGDVIEAGVFRGGASIFMRGVLAAHDVVDRTVWLADSFEGLPVPDVGRHPSDRIFEDWGWTGLVACSLEDVKANFERYGLLDDRVRFIKGWFKDTLSDAPVERLALIRLDADYHSSTTEALKALYPKLSVGGYVIVDDYGDLPPCKQAVDEFREREGITAPMVDIDHTGVYWKRETL